MARSVELIKALMDTQQALETALATLTNPSQTAEYELWKENVAIAINQLEQLNDILLTNIEAEVAVAAAGTEAWIKDKVLNLFQYSSSNPQILQLINFAPSYPTIDEDLRIVTRCSVKTNLNKIVQVKVAKSDPPVPLSSLEYSSLYGFLSKIRFAGVAFNLVNLTSDKLYLDAEVFYDGQYSSTIQADVEAAMDVYFANLPFDGVVKLSSIVDTIQAVEGVTDVVLNVVKVRADTVSLASATTIYDLSNGIDAVEYLTIAGYIVPETTASNTFADTITYTVSTQ